MKAIIGLGNPGFKFKFSRHNLGFLVIERLVEINKFKIRESSYNYLWAKGSFASREVLLVKPLTFMNLSGAVVALIRKQRKIRLANLLIVLDDINLPLGKIRIRSQGSDGGHQGLRSIIGALGRQDFPRLRIGVGSPKEQAKTDLTQYVLGRFLKKQSSIVNAAVEKSASCCQTWVQDGLAQAMDMFN